VCGVGYWLGLLWNFSNFLFEVPQCSSVIRSTSFLPYPLAFR